MARQRSHRRPSVDDRGPGVDLFDDPRWDPTPDEKPGALRRLRPLAFFGVLLLLGFLLVELFLSLAGLAGGFHFNLDLGSVTVPTTPPPSSDGFDIALSPDGSRAYVTEPSADRLLVLQTATGRLLASVAVGDDPSGLALSPDGAQVWVANTTVNPSSSVSGTPSETSGPSVSVVSTATDQVLATIPVGFDPIDVAFSPDGRRAFVTDFGSLVNGSVSVIDTATLAVVATLYTSTAAPSSVWNPTSVAITPDGDEVWVSGVDTESSASNDVYVFDPATAGQLARIAVGEGPFFMILSRDGRDAYVADKESCEIRRIDTATFRVTATVHWPEADGCPFGLADGPNDDVVYTVTGNDHTIDEGEEGNVFGAVDFGTGRVLLHTHVGVDPVTLALAPSGWVAYVVDADQPLIEVVNPATGATVSTIALPAGG